MVIQRLNRDDLVERESGVSAKATGSAVRQNHWNNAAGKRLA